jgi:exodeoxyribonuclease VII small subunit
MDKCAQSRLTGRRRAGLLPPKPREADFMNSETTPIPSTGEFEQSLAQLERLVSQLESGELTLEASLAAFEQGVSLTRSCQKALEAAEQRIKILSGQGQSEAMQDWTAPTSSTGN